MPRERRYALLDMAPQRRRVLMLFEQCLGKALWQRSMPKAV